MHYHVLTELTALPERLGRGERAASRLLQRKLRTSNIPFTIQTFSSRTPRFGSVELLADNQPVSCLPCGLVAGGLNNADTVVSSLTSSQSLIQTPNINFNPRTDVIGLSNFYFAPAWAVSRRDLLTLFEARSVRATLEVTPVTYRSENIVIGNHRSPHTIVFAHYDAYFSGATDNASGVACVFETIRCWPELCASVLFVFAGNEELSYDFPVYWGRGFREFARMNPHVLARAASVIVVDSVGDGSPILEHDVRLVQLAFPVGNPSVLKKTAILTGNFHALMNVYHSPADTIDRLKPHWLDATVMKLRDTLRSSRFVRERIPRTSKSL